MKYIIKFLIATGSDFDAMKIRKLDRYSIFGFRKEWLQLYFEDAKNFWNNDISKAKFKAFKFWGRESGWLDKNKNPASNFEKFSELGADSLKLWGIFWVNIAYNSTVTNVFVRNTNFDIAYDNKFFLEILGDSLKERIKKNALAALKNTFRKSPVGEDLKQGICELKGNRVISITRQIWEDFEPLVILYSLYKFAENSNEKYSFTLTELFDDNAERTALSPKILFGIDEKILRPLLQGLSNDYSDFISVDFNKEIMENIFLNKNKLADDVIQLF